jgi:ubiquinone/menaquinone biosynthesis C-methylase UbiE
MIMQTDASQFKESQRQSWDGVCGGWQKWWKTIENGTQNVSNRLVELAHIKLGDKILDLATGIGEPAITAARKVCNDGHVMATDISSGMLSIAKQRAASLGLESIMEFKEGDAETIDLPASSFNAVLCRWGLMFLPNLSGALSSIHSTLVPDGYLAAAVWATPDKCPFIALAVNTVRQATNAPVPPPGTPGPFNLADENQLRKSLIEIGFKDVHTERLDTTFEFNSAEDYTQFIKETVPPVIAMLANETKSRQDEIWNKVTDAAKKYSDDRGHVKFSSEAICIAGRR